MAIAPTILTAPTDFDIGVTVQIWEAGMPTLSISLTIVAPQRVQVPQVLVIIAASTPAAFNSSAISFPILVASATEVELPVVVIRYL